MIEFLDIVDIIFTYFFSEATALRQLFYAHHHHHVSDFQLS